MAFKGNPVLSMWHRLYSNPTKPELAMERAVAKLGVPYRFQHLVSCRYILDFALPDQMIAIEVDGPSHYTVKGLASDVERTAKLAEKGWTVVRCTNEEALADSEGTLRRMLQASPARNAA